MILLENTEVIGFEHAIRGMRNPMNSWHLSDSEFKDGLEIGYKDYELMMKLSEGGPVHAKYRRMIVVYVDITAPLYWWKEMDTNKIGTVSNSCSTMHKIHTKEFLIDDFSHDKLFGSSVSLLSDIVKQINYFREMFNSTKSKEYWWQMIQLLPSSYNQKRTVMLNYEVLANIYKSRRNHKLDEWKEFCAWIEKLPYSQVITNLWIS